MCIDWCTCQPMPRLSTYAGGGVAIARRDAALYAPVDCRIQLKSRYIVFGSDIWSSHYKCQNICLLLEVRWDLDQMRTKDNYENVSCLNSCNINRAQIIKHLFQFHHPTKFQNFHFKVNIIHHIWKEIKPQLVLTDFVELDLFEGMFE